MVISVSAADLDTTIVGVLGADAKFGGRDIYGDDGGVEAVEGLEGGYFHGNIIFRATFLPDTFSCSPVNY